MRQLSRLTAEDADQWGWKGAIAQQCLAPCPQASLAAAQPCERHLREPFKLYFPAVKPAWESPHALLTKPPDVVICYTIYDSIRRS